MAYRTRKLQEVSNSLNVLKVHDDFTHLLTVDQKEHGVDDFKSGFAEREGTFISYVTIDETWINHYPQTEWSADTTDS